MQESDPSSSFQVVEIGRTINLNLPLSHRPTLVKPNYVDCVNRASVRQVNIFQCYENELSMTRHLNMHLISSFSKRKRSRCPSCEQTQNFQSNIMLGHPNFIKRIVTADLKLHEHYKANKTLRDINSPQKQSFKLSTLLRNRKPDLFIIMISRIR